ncbi:MAG: PPC domain-containing DNA-binding protein [bacterium]
MAEEKPYLTGRAYLFNVRKGDDLLGAIQDFCHNNQIRCGVIHAIGSVESATVGFYDQKKKKYSKVLFDREMEIVSLTGNSSLLDDKPMVHAHILLSDSDGRAYGGHLMAGARVFACEVFIQEITGTPKIRKTDKATMLPLWCHVPAFSR